MKVTLNKANNILNKIQYDQKVSLSGYHSGYTRRQFNLTDSTSDIVNSLNDEKEAYQKDLISRKDLISDLYSLKALIFEENAKLGLNKILNEIDKIKKIILIEEDIFRGISSSSFKDNISGEEIEKEKNFYKEKESSTSFVVQIRFEKIEEVKNRIKELKKSLNSLEDKKTIINAMEIEISLSDTTMELLGL